MSTQVNSGLIEKTKAITRDLVDQGWFTSERIPDNLVTGEYPYFLIGWTVGSSEEATKIGRFMSELSVPAWISDESIYTHESLPQMFFRLDEDTLELVIQGESYRQNEVQIEFSRVITQEDMTTVLMRMRNLGFILYDARGPSI